MPRSSFCPVFSEKLAFRHVGKLVTMHRWQNSNDSWTFTASPASSHGPPFAASSAIPWPSSSPLSAAEKNALWRLRASVSHLLRQTAPPCPRLGLWRQACLSRFPGAKGFLLRVWRSETRTDRLARRQPVLHQTLRVLRRPAVPRDYGQGSGRRSVPRL